MLTIVTYYNNFKSNIDQSCFRDFFEKIKVKIKLNKN